MPVEKSVPANNLIVNIVRILLRVFKLHKNQMICYLFIDLRVQILELLQTTKFLNVPMNKQTT